MDDKGDYLFTPIDVKILNYAIQDADEIFSPP